MFAGVSIIGYDTGVDIDALLDASAALLGATLIIVLAYAFGFRLVMAIWNKSRAFLKVDREVFDGETGGGPMSVVPWHWQCGQCGRFVRDDCDVCGYCSGEWDG